MASVTATTPILDATPEMEAAVTSFLAACEAEDEAYQQFGAISCEWDEAVGRRHRAWAAVEAAFPAGRVGWHRIAGRWWGRTKVSKCGLVLVSRRELPAGLRARLAGETGAAR